MTQQNALAWIGAISGTRTRTHWWVMDTSDFSPFWLSTPVTRVSRTGLDKAVTELIAAGEEFSRRGWLSATSGNFSAVLSDDPLTVLITASGKDKGALARNDFLQVDERGRVMAGAGRPSAETRLHLKILECCMASTVLHTHSVWSTVLSEIHAAFGYFELEGFEMLKGLAGVTSHDHTEVVPILENKQDYAMLSDDLSRILADHPAAHGILLRRHGLYTWGAGIAEARRHVEVLEFLFEVAVRLQESHSSIRH